MLKWVLGLLLMIGGIGFAALVMFAAGMASRSTTLADTWSAWIGVAVAVLGLVVLIWG